MLKMRLCMAAAIGLFSGASLYAQEKPEQPKSDQPEKQERKPRVRGNRNRGEDGQRQGEGRRMRGQQRWRDMENASPEEARQMRIDAMMERLTRTYELTDEQKVTVRAEVTKMSDEYRASLGKDGDEMEKIRTEMRDYWKQRRAAAEKDANPQDREQRRGPMRDPKFQELMERMRTLREQHPIDWDAPIERVEALLPPEQVARGKARREKRMEEFRERRNAGNDAEQGGRRGRGRGRRNRDADAANERQSEQRRTERRAEEHARSPLAGPSASVAPASQHPWDILTDAFIVTNHLNETQAASAHAVVTGLKQRELAVRRSQEADRASAQKLSNEAKAKRFKELDAPVDALAAELDARLEALLTAEQRAKAAKK